MYPILFEWNGLVIPTWHTFFAIAAIVGFFLWVKLGKAIAPEVADQEFSRLYLIGYLAGYFGARLFSIFVEQPEFTGFAIITELFRLGPMTMYGGLLGCFASAAIYVRAKGLPFWKLSDAAFVAGIFAVGIGRIGCFFNGDDYGVAVNIIDDVVPWWAVSFPNHPSPIPRYPVQLIESFFCLLWAGFLAWHLVKKPTKWRPGGVALLALGGYALFRFVIEYWRDDARGWVIEQTLSPSQLVSLVAIAICSLAMFFRWRLAR